MTAVALTIAGSDPSGGAGLQADLKTFHRFGVYGEAVPTLITVQNTVRVSRVEVLAADLVAEQIQAVLEDIPPHAAKTGALGSREIVEAVAREAQRFTFPLVVDPVMISTAGMSLFRDLVFDDAFGVFIEKLIPHAFLLTPNVPEANMIAGFAIHDRETMLRAAKKMMALGAKNVLIKGGHLETGFEREAFDLLMTANGGIYEFTAPRIDTVHIHGTGCTLSAAITAELAKGTPLVDAVASAKKFITEAIRTNPHLGSGRGPVNHHA